MTRWGAGSRWGVTEALGAHIRTMLSHPPSILDSIADEGWRDALEAKLPAGYAERIALELAVRTRAGGRIAPALSIAFRALDLAAIDQMHVVIVGHPYRHRHTGQRAWPTASAAFE